MSKMVFKPQNKRDDNRNQKSNKKDLKKIYESPKFFLRENTEKLQDIFREEFTDIIDQYINWRKGKGKRPEWITNLMMDLAFVSIFSELISDNDDYVIDNGDFVCELISNSVGELQRRRVNHSDTMIEILTEIYTNLNGEHVQEVFDLELGFSWDESAKIAIVSHGSPKYTVNNTLRIIYNMKIHDMDDLELLLKTLYGKKELPKVGIYILLERKNPPGKGNWIDKETFDLVTQFALSIIEEQKKDEIKSLFKVFIDERRRSEFDTASFRRVNLSELSKDEYPRIIKVTKKLAKKNKMNKIFLDRKRNKVPARNYSQNNNNNRRY